MFGKIGQTTAVTRSHSPVKMCQALAWKVIEVIAGESLGIMRFLPLLFSLIGKRLSVISPNYSSR